MTIYDILWYSKTIYDQFKLSLWCKREIEEKRIKKIEKTNCVLCLFKKKSHLVKVFRNWIDRVSIKNVAGVEPKGETNQITGSNDFSAWFSFETYEFNLSFDMTLFQVWLHVQFIQFYQNELTTLELSKRIVMLMFVSILLEGILTFWHFDQIHFTWMECFQLIY